MNAEEEFISIAVLICEPSRAGMLWNLLDGRAYTASELAVSVGISPTAASNHLSKLLDASIVKVDIQGRHRYYSIINSEVAFAVEALANLAANKTSVTKGKEPEKNGIKYCRSCYDHLAGYLGVKIVEAFEQKGYLSKFEQGYSISDKGKKWFKKLDIHTEDFTRSRRPATRQCLDWSERRPHLAGQLGAALFKKATERKWFKKVAFSRELIVTAKGRQDLYELLDITI